MYKSTNINAIKVNKQIKSQPFLLKRENGNTLTSAFRSTYTILASLNTYLGFY